MIDWSHWHNEPHLVGGILFFSWSFAIACGPLNSKISLGHIPAKNYIQFYLGLIIFYIAVGSPLDQAGERYLLSAHMIQHQLLMYPAAILVLRGLPAQLVDKILDISGLRKMRLLFSPLSCCLIFSLTISIWHIPALYDLALQNRWIHIFEHLCFFIAAIFFWWPILSPSNLIPSRTRGVQLLYLSAVTIAMTPVFAAITFSSDVLYPTYEFAPRIFFEMSAIEDQKLGGAIMKAGGLSVTLISMTITFFKWSSDDRSAGAQ